MTQPPSQPGDGTSQPDSAETGPIVPPAAGPTSGGYPQPGSSSSFGDAASSSGTGGSTGSTGYQPPSYSSSSDPGSTPPPPQPESPSPSGGSGGQGPSGSPLAPTPGQSPGGYTPPPPPPSSDPGASPPPGGYAPPPGQYAPPPQGGYPPPPPPPPGQTYGPPPGQGYGPPPGQSYGPPPGQAYGPPPGQGYGAPQGQSYGPPPGQQGFPPSGGQPGGPASGSGLNIDVSKVGTLDWIVLGLGVLALIFTFFGWVSSSGFGVSASAGAWHEYWFFAPVLILAVVVIRALQIFVRQVKQVRIFWLALAALLAVVIAIIALIEIFAQTSDSSLTGDQCAGLTGSALDACQSTVDAFDISIGPGFGIWAFIILGLALAYFLLLSAQRNGEKLPVTVPGPTL